MSIKYHKIRLASNKFDENTTYKYYIKYGELISLTVLNEIGIF